MQKCFYYNLLEIKEFNKILLGEPLTNEKIIVTDYFTKSNKKYKLVRYNKDVLSLDNISSYGLLKSVIINSDNKVISFCPPKSISLDTFINLYPTISSNIFIEEMIDGIMINLFWDPAIGINGGWEIATRNSVGGELKINETISIKNIFIETCKFNSVDINLLNKDYCYSFVLQHPLYKPIQNPKIYLVELYRIVQVNNSIYIHPVVLGDFENNLLYNFNLKSSILYPQRYSNNDYDYENYIKTHASCNTDYSKMGIIIRNLFTGERCKVINPNYLMANKMTINKSELLFLFLVLRKQGKISEYLLNYPKNKKKFSKFREILHNFTKNLFQNYIECYVKKIISINNISSQFKSHLQNLHYKYLHELRYMKLCISITFVIQYFNNLQPQQQLFAINYHFREKNLDSLCISYH